MESSTHIAINPEAVAREIIAEATESIRDLKDTNPQAAGAIDEAVQAELGEVGYVPLDEVKDDSAEVSERVGRRTGLTRDEFLARIALNQTLRQRTKAHAAKRSAIPARGV